MKQLSTVKKTLDRMLIHTKNKISKGTVIIIFTAITFTFLHSELGLLDFDGHNHGVHDYCEIVKNTNTHSKILREELPKLELHKGICIHCFEEIEAQATQIRFERTDHHRVVKQSTEAYLFNKSFLI